MATVTGLTADRMLEIEAASVIDGEVVDGDLILSKHDGTLINAGSVIGPEGPEGPVGSDLDVLAAMTVGHVGLANQIRAGRRLTASDFANLGLSAPAGLWNFTGSLADSSGYGRNLTNKGSVPFAVGINGGSGTAVQFVASTGQALYLLDTGASDPFRIKVGSFGCWFRSGRTGINQNLIAKNGPAPLQGWQLYIATTNVLVSRLSSTGSDSFDAQGTKEVTDDRWHMVVVTFDGSRHILYLDGVVEDTNEENFLIFGSSKPLNIGAQNADAGTVATNPYAGRIDEAFITSDILTAKQVKNLYATRVSHTLAELPSRVSLNISRRRKGAALVSGDFPATPFRMYNFSAASLANEGSQGATGDLTTGGTAPVSVAGADGTPGNAFNFLANGYLQCTDTGMPSGLSTFSCGCWVKTSSDVAGPTYIITWGTTNGTNDVRLYIEDGEIRMGSGSFLTNSAVDIADGNWHLIVLVHDNTAADGGLRKLYLDGRLIAVGTNMASITLGGANKFLIGISLSLNTAHRFIGQLDGVFATTSALTIDDILKLYMKSGQQLQSAPLNVENYVEALSDTELLLNLEALDLVDKVDLKVSA